MLLLVTLLLIGTGILAATSSLLLRMGRLQVEEELKTCGPFFFFHPFLTLLFKGKEWEGLLLSANITRQIFRLAYAAFAIMYLFLHQTYFVEFVNTSPQQPLDFLKMLGITGFIIVISLISDFIISLIAMIQPQVFFRATSPLVSLCLVILLPITAPLLKILNRFFNSPAHKKIPLSFNLRDKVLDLLRESELSPYLDANDQKLLLSVVSFKERNAREVMVPRVDVFSLPADTTLQEAAKSFLSEGYSRIPVYKDSVDHIIGVLLYKDVLKVYARFQGQPSFTQQLQMPIENLLKPILYMPETKKISSILQEFRTKQMHLAIIVDEYGGTEGIITIEDILEELVGEIADEYDIGEEMMYSRLPGGGWVVDARMTIVDIEEDLGIKIPLSGDYDTIGGYIYHRAGAIPSKGWRIHHDEFDLEVLSSDERSIDKIRITPHSID